MIKEIIAKVAYTAVDTMLSTYGVRESVTWQNYKYQENYVKWIANLLDNLNLEPEVLWSFAVNNGVVSDKPYIEATDYEKAELCLTVAIVKALYNLL